MNVVGWWWKGRPQIEKKVAAAHVLMFRDSVVTNSIADDSSRMALAESSIRC